MLLQVGLIDLPQYAAHYNEILSEYYRSPVRNENNQRILRDFFTNSAVYKLPYRRGMLLATKWNEIISRQSGGSKSLDDVMHQILRDARTGKVKEISTDYVVSVLSRHASHDFAGDVEKYVEKGDTITDFKGVFGDCIDSAVVIPDQFELGFDFETARTSRITAQVVKNSAAYAAGVRDGQKILSVSVQFGKTDKPVKLKIEEGGQSREITYFPEAIEKISMPQFKVRENLTENEIRRCLNAGLVSKF
jgi:predicted metalloprotease with PDZ domain